MQEAICLVNAAQIGCLDTSISSSNWCAGADTRQARRETEEQHENDERAAVVAESEAGVNDRVMVATVPAETATASMSRGGGFP